MPRLLTADFSTRFPISVGQGTLPGATLGAAHRARGTTSSVSTTLDATSAELDGADEEGSHDLRAATRYLAALAQGSEPAGEDAAAWERFYAAYDPFIRRIVRRARLGEADADDCVQEAWAELIGALASFAYDPRRGRFEGWLFVVVRRKVAQFFRRRARQPASRLADAAEALCSADPDPPTAFQQQEDREWTRRLLALMRPQISEANYRLLQLRWIQDREIAEIASQVAMTPAQVRYRLHRLKRKIRLLLPHSLARRAMVA